jgi:hypothetical protein
MLGELLLGVLSNVVYETGKTGLRKLLEKTPVRKAIDSTAKNFPDIDNVKNSLAVWLHSDAFATLVNALNQDNIPQVQEGLVDSFVEVGKFYVGLNNTHNSARLVLETFSRHLEEELYRSEEAHLIEAHRAKIRHRENQAGFEKINSQVNELIHEIKAQEVRLHTFLQPTQFFEHYLKPHRIFHHRLPQVGRRIQLNELLGFAGGINQIAILPGRGGSGKSKLIHTLCRRLVRRQPNLNVRLVAENYAIKESALLELPEGNCLVIVDDAHRTNGIEVILVAARHNPILKVLLVTRPHATDYLTVQAVNAGFDRSEIVTTNPLPELNYAREHRQLARLVLGPDWAHYTDELASATRDSPLLTVLGGELLRREQVIPASLIQNDTFRWVVLQRFRDIRLGEIVLQLDVPFTKELCTDALQLVAALTPFDLEHTALLQAVAQLLRIDEVKLRQLLGALIKAGALVSGGKLVRIVPDVLSDFILHEACFTPDGVPTGWANRVYKAVADLRLDVVLRNLAELDWRVRTAPTSQDQLAVVLATSETGLLDSIWLDIEERFRSSSLAERKGWLTRLERIAFMQPHRVWPLVEIACNEPVAEDPGEVSSILRPLLGPTTQGDVLAALGPILRGIARDDNYTARCADLLWEMGRDLETKPSYSPSAIETLRHLAAYESSKAFTFSFIILECCREWMNDPNIHTYRHSILKVISPMLGRRVDWTGTEKRWHSNGSYILPPEPLQKLRRSALELVEHCALSGSRRVVLEALHTLATPISEEGLWEIRNENPEEWQWWESEQLAALEIVARIAQRNDDPFVRLKIWEALHEQAERGPRTNVQDRAREILETLPLSFESRFILLLTNGHIARCYRRTWVTPEEDDDDWLKADKGTRHLIEQKHYQRDLEFARQVTREWIKQHPDPYEGFDVLDEWIERIETSGWWNESWTRSNPFMVQLAIDYPSYARTWCEIAPEKPEARTTGKCDDLLCELRRQDQEEALKLAQRFLASNHPNLWLRVAASYAWRCWPSEPLPEELQIIRDMLAYHYPQVRRRAADIVSAISSTEMNLAVDIVLETDIGEDSELANGLFKIFEKHGGFDFNEITSDKLEQLLGKLRMVESVHSYHLGQFLLHAALRDPIAVAQLLLSRVQRKAELNKESWEKPSADSHTQAQHLVNSFAGLPRSGFHEKEFKEIENHPNYKAALRLIRDAALGEEYSSVLLHEDTLSELFRDFSLNFCPASLEVLDEWINLEDCVKLKAAMRLLGDTYLGFYVSNVSFISNYLRRAKECGKGVFEEVERDMLHSAEYGPPRAIASRRGERSNALFYNANKALEDFQGDPLTVRFFQKLRDRGHKRIQSEMRQAAEEEVFFRS